MKSRDLDRSDAAWSCRAAGKVPCISRCYHSITLFAANSIAAQQIHAVKMIGADARYLRSSVKQVPSATRDASESDLP